MFITLQVFQIRKLGFNFFELNKHQHTDCFLKNTPFLTLYKVLGKDTMANL